MHAARQNDTGKDYTAEGLRGLAAVNVFLSHFFLAFFPLGFDKLFPGLQKSSAQDGTMEQILRTPFASIFWNGTFAVCVFFVLSGFVLSKPYYIGGRLDALRDRYLKRYPRLSIPIAASIALGYALLRLHWFHNLPAADISHSDWLRQYFNFQPTFEGALRDMLYRSIFLGEIRYNPPLWTMRIELIGSLLTFAFYTLMPAARWRKALHYITTVACLIAFTQQDAIYYFAFLLGGLIWALPRPRGAAVVALLAAAWFGGAFQFSWPFLVLPDPRIWDIKLFYNVIAAFALFWALRSGWFDAVLGSRPLRSLGRMSFSFYLTHFLVLGTFSCWFFVHFSTGRWPRELLLGLDGILSFLLALAVANLFERWVDRPGIALSQQLVRGPVAQRPAVAS